MQAYTPKEQSPQTADIASTIVDCSYWDMNSTFVYTANVIHHPLYIIDTTSIKNNNGNNDGIYNDKKNWQSNSKSIQCSIYTHHNSAKNVEPEQPAFKKKDDKGCKSL